MQSLILRTAARLMVGLILVFAIYLLLRGHHEPGGGFSAALLAGTAFALFALSEGPSKVQSAIRISPRLLALIGLGLGILAGVPGLLLGRPFLTGIWWHVGEIAIGTPLIFDIGVFLAVLGAVLSILLSLEAL